MGNLFSLRNEKKWKPLPLFHRQETVKVHFLLSEKEMILFNPWKLHDDAKTIIKMEDKKENVDKNFK